MLVLNLKRKTKGLSRETIVEGRTSHTQCQHVSKNYKYMCNIKLTTLIIHTIQINYKSLNYL